MTGEAIFFGVLWGTVLGLFYFGGLWLTVLRVPAAAKPRRLLLLSFAVRLAGVMTGFWFILQQGAVILALTLFCFFLVRLALTKIIGQPLKRGIHANQP